MVSSLSAGAKAVAARAAQIRTITTVTNSGCTGPVHRLAEYAGGRLELWLTPCIVTMPPPNSTHLVVPSNERLVGTQFSHFPVGGPTPSAPYIGSPPTPPDDDENTFSSQNNYDTLIADYILYASETVDGTVTEYAGPDFERQVHKHCPIVQDLSETLYPIRCPTGQARNIPSVGYLKQNFDGLILTVAPFYNDPQWERLLESAYTHAIQLARNHPNDDNYPRTADTATSLATPLLGAGARGAPTQEAARVATNVLMTSLEKETFGRDDLTAKHDDIDDSPNIVRLCVLEEEVADIIHNTILEQIKQANSMQVDQ